MLVALPVTVTVAPVVITIPRPPTPVIGENKLRGMHWGQRARAMDPWRDEIAWLAKRHRAAIRAMPKPVTIAITFRFPLNRVRDPSNLNGGGITKALIDGIVNAGCLPGDDPRYVRTVEPVLLVDKTSQAVTLTITPAAP